MRTKRVWTGIAAGFLLLTFILPQPALADPAGITLSQNAGYCGDLIKATATVDQAGTYRICWNSRAPAGLEDTFETTGAGNRTTQFSIPVTVRGTYTVYLTREDYSQVATANFTVIPFVKIEPNKGPVGTVVAFSGNGFPASQDIQVSFLGVASTTKGSTTGTWTMNYTIPATPAGPYTFGVGFKEGTESYNLTGKSFQVTPQITAPSSGKVGQTIQVKGTGFGSGEGGIKVTFTRQGTSAEVVAKQGISADAHGSWEATVVVPAVQGGTYGVGASGTVTRARDVPGVSFTMTAGILVEPNSAYVGDTITVTGGGFAPAETGIRVTFDGQSEASSITAHSDGTWGSSFVLPPSAYGAHTVSASGDITPATTATVNTQARIEDFSPIQGAPGDSVSLTASGFPSGQPLTVTIGGVAASGDLRTLPNGNVAINFPVPRGSVPGRQALVVSDGSGATASGFFTVTEKILATPQPISPRDGSTLRSGEVTFQWGATTGGGNVSYTLQISDSPDLATYVRSISDLQTASYTLTEDESLLKGVYYWWVRAEDSYGNQSPYSDSSKFSVSPIPPWVWVVIGVVVFLVLMVVAYRETKFRVTE